MLLPEPSVQQRRHHGIDARANQHRRARFPLRESPEGVALRDADLHRPVGAVIVQGRRAGVQAQTDLVLDWHLLRERRARDEQQHQGCDHHQVLPEGLSDLGEPSNRLFILHK